VAVICIVLGELYKEIGFSWCVLVSAVICTATLWSQFLLSWLALLQSRDNPRDNKSSIKQYFSLTSRRDGIDWRPIFYGRTSPSRDLISEGAFISWCCGFILVKRRVW